MNVFEFPLTSATRLLLRLRDRFESLSHFLESDHLSSHKAFMINLFEVFDICFRVDIKVDLLYEIEKQKQILSSPQFNRLPPHDIRLHMERLEEASSRLSAYPGRIGYHLKENDWLMSLRQKMANFIQVSDFDIQSYRYWLSMPVEERQECMRSWLSPFALVQEVSGVLVSFLKLISVSEQCYAVDGQFQKSLSKVSPSCLVVIQTQSPCFPEVFANRFVLNVRFLDYHASVRPTPYQKDVSFELLSCHAS